jgi:hypothetical protein
MDPESLPPGKHGLRRPVAMKAIAILTCALTLGLGAPAFSEPVAVKFTEGVGHTFLILRSVGGEKLAQGELIQIPRGDRVENRLTFRFRDGSLYDEHVVFSQRETFTLMSYQLVQKGPSFPESIDAKIDRESGRYEVRYKGDEEATEEVLQGKLELPSDVYNGLLCMLMKNMPAGTASTVHIIAFTPKPRLVEMLLTPAGDETVMIGEVAVSATRFLIKPQLGLFASLLVTDLPDMKVWILGGEAPAFLQFEGPLFLMGPIWRIN